MRTYLLSVLAVTVAFLLGRISAQDIAHSCPMCPATHVPATEIQRYADVGREEQIIDQQVRSIDIGKANVQIAVAEHHR